MRRVIIFLIFVAIISVSGFYYFWPEDPLIKAAQSAGGYPYQIGLTGATVTQCQLSCYVEGIPTCCIGGTLCAIKDVARCILYSDVSGSPAGGMGSNALFLVTAIGQAGLSSGGQLIAGGMSMTEMDQGVLASAGGCSGCTAKSGTGDKIFVWLEKLDKYIIAGIRDKIK